MALVLAGMVWAAATQPPAPKADPRIPVPILSDPYDCRLYTDWRPLLRAQPPAWRYATRVPDTDSWEEAACGRAGGRFRTRVARTDDTTTEATTGRRAAGDGGIGAGFEAKMYVGVCFDARVLMEFAPAGPRVVVSATYWPIDGREVAVGWNLLANELVRRDGWFFDAADIAEMWFWQVYVPALVAARAQLGRFVPRARE